MSNIAPNQFSSTTTGNKPGAVAPIAWSSFGTELRTRRPTTIHTVLAPRRFDIHRLPDVAAWLDQAEKLGADRLVVDLSEVRFIDNAALDAIDMLFTNKSVDVECVNPSPAFSLTARLVSQSAATTTESVLSLSTGSAAAASADPLSVVVNGDLTVANAHEFRSQLADAIDTAIDSGGLCQQPVVIDLSNVNRLDAAGLVGVTSMVLEMRRQGRCVTVIEPNGPHAAQFARLTGILPKLATATC